MKLVIVKSDADGRFNQKLIPQANFDLQGVCEGCYSQRDVVSTVGKKYSEDFYVDFAVEKMIINKPILMKNILCDYNKWDIRADASVDLDKLVRLLNENPKISVELGSHIDMHGSDAYNQKTSENLIKPAVEYLFPKWIDPEHLTYKGYGVTRTSHKTYPSNVMF
jgi:peptidoglycan-associated lipoprotein